MTPSSRRRDNGARAARSRRFLLAMALASAAMFPPVHAFAQTLDEVEASTQEASQTVRLRFNASVRFLQIVPAGSADLFTVRFELVAADRPVLEQSVEEVRRLSPVAGRPGMVFRYVPDRGNRMQQIELQLSAAAAVRARQGPNARTLEFIVAAGAAAPTAAPRFTVELERIRLSDSPQVRVLPVELQSLEVSTEDVEIEGQPGIRLLLGKFADRAAAEAALARARPAYPAATVVAIETPAERAAAAPTATPALAPAPLPGPASADVEAKAGALMQRARDALAQKQPDDAVAALNELLKLPPNGQTVAAQELIGNAWEAAEAPGRARIEYELYMKLYPTAEGAGRVSERLAALGAPVTPTGSTAQAQSQPAAAASNYTGSVAQYYYGGKARTKSLVNIATGIDQATLSKTTESSIVTSADVSGSWTRGENETRAVLRGSASKNLMSGGRSDSSISSAYVEYRRQALGLAVRAGRQSPISGGLLGLFEGVSLAYSIKPGIKLDVMGGVPAGGLTSAPSERLFATVLEADSIAQRWGGNIYLLTQSTQGITNRRAVGAEVRYAGDAWSMNTLVDYDTLFSQLNALSAHLTFLGDNQTSYTFLVDRRRAPSLQLTNALISSGVGSLEDLLRTRTMDQIRADALATSAIADQILFSMSRPVGAKWQLSGDLRYSQVGALPAVGDFEATQPTGAQYSLGLQLTGTNLYSSRDINNFNMTMVTTPTFKGVQLAYNNLSSLERWRDLTLEPSIRFYTQRDKDDVKLQRIGPGMRLTYRASRRTSLLGELLFEFSKTDGPTNHDSSQSTFFYVGYRYELF